jgi:hypothetical protein
MCAAIAAVVVTAACTTKDNNSVTGSTDYSSVALSSNPSSFDLHVRLVPQKIDTSSTTHVIDTIPAHEVPVDSVAFDPIATIMPADVAIANGIDNMTFTFDNSVASLNESFFVQGDTTGTTTLAVVYTDVNHNFATTTMVLPVTVTQVP